ncbi:hypothetical protein QVH35_05400 [Candidatus Nitrosotenuis chungbukensis]|uniref:hypothetical protein n=1 Tax=Candidatus Nitrosotenuis chungbukensis TaxID=1353246 RepID=UPI0015A4F66B|nr:hypothetical protein [Candidatus Nitrosotenuis chungbukensis]WKT58763.1 hypothetical protein QVH35_05400 [Candidatus Nitrosotenuis chungbukensis]
MNPEWVVTGIILFGGMAAAGFSLYLKRRKESLISDSFYDIPQDLEESEKDKK